MPTKKKEKIIVDGDQEVKVASPEEIEAARKQAEVNADKAPVVEAPVKEAPKKAEPVKPVTTQVIFKSLDGRSLQVGVGKFFAEGKTISVPLELAEEVERLLTTGHYLITRIN